MEEMKNVYLYNRTPLTCNTLPPPWNQTFNNRGKLYTLGAIAVLHLLDKTKLLVKQEVEEERRRS